MGDAGEMAGWPCPCGSLCSRRREAAETLHRLLSGRGPCLSWQESNINNCIDYTTRLLSLEMSLCLPLEKWNYRNRRETVSGLWWKIYNKATLKVCCLVIRHKRLLSGCYIRFLELWLVSRAKCRCSVSIIKFLSYIFAQVHLPWVDSLTSLFL